MSGVAHERGHAHDPVRALLHGALVRHGAIVEPDECGLDVLLPEDLATVLELPEAARLLLAKPDGGSVSGSASANGDAHLATIGSPLLERLLAFVRRRGVVARVRLGERYLKRDRLAEAVRAVVAFADAKVVIGGASESHASYLDVRLRFTATSETRHEGLLAIRVNEESLGIVPSSAIDPADPTNRPWADTATARPLEQVLASIERAARRELVARLAAFRQSIERRAVRDQQRITAYYADLLAEHDRRAARSHGDDAAAALLADKRAAIDRDRAAKLSGLRDRLAIRVQVRGLAACRLLVPVMAIPVELHVGREITRRRLFWSPLTKAVEAPPCEACGEPAATLFVVGHDALRCKQCAAGAAARLTAAPPTRHP